MLPRVIPWLRTRMITGVVVLAPLALTFWIFYTLFVKLDGLLAVVIQKAIGRHIPGSGFIALLLLILLTGAFARNFIGGKMISLGNLILFRIPIVNKIYTAIQQITHVFIGEKKTLFQRVVLFEYPRKESYVLGFVTSMDSGEVESKVGEKLVSVFLPTTPNPTSGFLLFVPEKDIIFLDMSVEDGIKMVISGGAVIPEMKKFETEVGVDHGSGEYNS
ncbi:MAG: DUF502 domain-containing protein [Candidatus Glassbacteria bacterium]